jgi:hypothetical protein
MGLAVAEISGNDHPISRNSNYYCYILKVHCNTLENFIIVGKAPKKIRIVLDIEQAMAWNYGTMLVKS